MSGFSGGTANLIVPPQGRLTLTSATPVLTASVTGATTLYYALHVGNRIPIWTGAAWQSLTFTELSLALDSNSGHTGYQQSGKNFDVFYAYVAGTLYFGTGPAWTSDTGRGTGAGTTELQQLNGIYTNKVSMTLRFGSSSGNTVTVPTNQGTYLGTIRATADGQTSFTFGSVATNGGAAVFAVWNAYNRVRVPVYCADSTSSWTLTSSTVRAWNAQNGVRCSFVRGLDVDAVNIRVQQLVDLSAVGAFWTLLIGLDSTTVQAQNCLSVYSEVSGLIRHCFTGVYSGLPGLGWHYLQALEASDGSHSQAAANGGAGSMQGEVAA